MTARVSFGIGAAALESPANRQCDVPTPYGLRVPRFPVSSFPWLAPESLVFLRIYFYLILLFFACILGHFARSASAPWHEFSTPFGSWLAGLGQIGGAENRFSENLGTIIGCANAYVSNVRKGSPQCFRKAGRLQSRAFCQAHTMRCGVRVTGWGTPPDTAVECWRQQGLTRIWTSI